MSGYDWIVWAWLFVDGIFVFRGGDGKECGESVNGGEVMGRGEGRRRIGKGKGR